MWKCRLIAGATLVIVFFSAGLLQSSWRAIPLSDRIKDADLVVVGQMTITKPKYFSVMWHDREKYTDVYDIGYIRPDRVLKGSSDGSIGFRCDHPKQPDNPFAHMKMTFPEKQRRIWLLHRGIGGFYYVRRPDNVLKLDALPDVKEALQELERETGKRHRIVVRKGSEKHEPYVAFIEGKESHTRSVGRDQYEAVGRLILSGRSIPDLGIDYEIQRESKQNE